MFSSNDSNFDVPSETSSSMITFCTPPQTPRKTRKMVVEVVIPIQKSAKRHSSSPVEEVADLATRRPERIRISDPSPARSDSSISLGTHWHISPNKKRRRNRKGRDAAAEGEGEQARPRKRRCNRRGQRRTSIQTDQEEHITTIQPDPASPLATPITLDRPPDPRLVATSPSKPRACLSSSAPRMRINLESARLETIQAQESARGYDIYRHWPTSPGSGSAKTRAGNSPNTPTTPSYSEPRSQLNETNDTGSSVGPGTLERHRILGEQSWSFETHASNSQKPSLPSKSVTPSTPLMKDWSYPLFSDSVEAQWGTVSPEVNRFARLGLQTALEELVERYEFPLSNVSKLYRSKGCLEETERVLWQLRRMEDELRKMKKAAFGDE